MAYILMSMGMSMSMTLIDRMMAGSDVNSGWTREEVKEDGKE